MAVGLKLTIITCLALKFLHTVYLFIPPQTVLLYEQAMRPAIYTILMVMVYVFIGSDVRHIPKSYEINIVTAFSALFYASVFTAMVHFMGSGINAAQPGSLIIAGRNAWTIGVPVILGAFIRFKLVKAVKNHNIAILCLTLVFAYGELDVIRQFIRIGRLSVPDFIFAHIFVAITTSATLSFFSLRGNLLSVIVLSMIYIVSPNFVPILPHVNPIVWGLMVCGLLLLSSIVLHLLTHDKNKPAQQRERRATKYEKKSFLYYSIILTLIILIIAFNTRKFPVYPVVILTESMTGTLNRGSVVFMHKVNEDNVFIRVGEGEIIHFSHGQIEFVHRVTGFVHNAYGEREYITQGDANDITDPFTVSQENVIGTTIAFLPLIGYPYVIVMNLFGR